VPQRLSSVLSEARYQCRAFSPPCEPDLNVTECFLSSGRRGFAGGFASFVGRFSNSLFFSFAFLSNEWINNPLPLKYLVDCFKQIPETTFLLPLRFHFLLPSRTSVHLLIPLSQWQANNLSTLFQRPQSPMPAYPKHQHESTGTNFAPPSPDCFGLPHLHSRRSLGNLSSLSTFVWLKRTILPGL